MPDELSENSTQTPEPPELAKNIYWFQHLIQSNWEAVTRPSVIMIIIIICVLGYFYGVTRGNEELKIKDERLSFANEQLSAYKDRLNGASPDQAAKEIAVLRSRVETDENKLNRIFPDQPRRLSSKQADILGKELDFLRQPGKAISVYASMIGDSLAFAGDFLTLFSKKQIQYSGAMWVVCVGDEKGLLVGLKNEAAPSEDAAKFYRTLGEAGLNPHYTKWEDNTGSTFDFDLFICP